VSRLCWVPSHPKDNIWATMIVSRMRRKIMRTDLCFIVYHSCTLTYEQFLQNTVGLGLGLYVFYIFFWTSDSVLGLDFVYCIFWIFSWVWLSLLLQLIAWKDSSLRWCDVSSQILKSGHSLALVLRHYIWCDASNNVLIYV